LIGTVEIVDCIEYRSRSRFKRDAGKHGVPPGNWTKPLYGFILRKPRRTPYLPCRGALKFFLPKRS
jgi:hypothetical protein